MLLYSNKLKVALWPIVLPVLCFSGVGIPIQTGAIYSKYGLDLSFYSTNYRLDYSVITDTSSSSRDIAIYFPFQGGPKYAFGNRLEISGIPFFLILMNFWDLTAKLRLFTLGSTNRLGNMTLSVIGNTAGYLNIASWFSYCFSSAGCILSSSCLTPVGRCDMIVTEALVQNVNGDMADLDISVNAKTRSRMTSLGLQIRPETGVLSDCIFTIGIARFVPFLFESWTNFSFGNEGHIRIQYITPKKFYLYQIGCGINLD